KIAYHFCDWNHYCHSFWSLNYTGTEAWERTFFLDWLLGSFYEDPFPPSNPLFLICFCHRLPWPQELRLLDHLLSEHAERKRELFMLSIHLYFICMMHSSDCYCKCLLPERKYLEGVVILVICILIWQQYMRELDELRDERALSHKFRF